MMFNMGKSNAKVYVKSSNGIRFSDVAGEDEAKENLTEIVVEPRYAQVLNFEECHDLTLSGLMVVPPLEGDAAAHFADAAEVAEGLRRAHPGAIGFSAGMSGDIEAAIAAGSTCVRVGTAILGPRPVV